MLFLKRRYYVFDDAHSLLDGGVIRYNQTLDKIFIRNEDLRGEIFISKNKDEKIRLTGSISSKTGGLINIDNILSRYDKTLQAPLSRVAKVEKYLKPADIYHILKTQKEIDAVFIRHFEKNMLTFTPQQAKQLYIRLSQDYFQNYDKDLLSQIALYFSAYPLDGRLYEELFMFIMAIQTAGENKNLRQEDIDYFIAQVEKRLLDAYKKAPQSISSNMINECLLYFGLDSPYLPSLQQCIAKLYDRKLTVQQEYAYYLVLMQEKVKEAEEELYKRLVGFYQENFFAFKESVLDRDSFPVKKKKLVTGFSTLLALIKALGNCKSENKDIHILFLFLLCNHEEQIRETAKRALIQCKNHVKVTLPELYHLDEALKDEVMKIIDSKP